MRILIAEDEPVSRRVLDASLQKWGYEVITCTNGVEAYNRLLEKDAPQLAILDWMMPGMEGLEVCRRLRDTGKTEATYIILLTARGRREDIIAGLDAGADDYITKPFDREELRARLRAGMRIVELQNSLAERVRELEDALSQVKQLRGLLPICSYCKKVRGDHDYWQQVEGYIAEHSNVEFSHSVCPECYEKFVKNTLDGDEEDSSGP